MISIVGRTERAFLTGDPRGIQKFIVTRVEGEASLGVQLLQKEGGGAIVKNVSPSGLAVQCSEIKPKSELVKINEEDVSKWLLGDILKLLSSVGRPVKLMWCFFEHEKQISIPISAHL